MNLPSTDQIESLHHKYAPSDKVFDLVWTHCCIVRDIALQIISNNNLTLNSELITVGCLLHDIGVYPLLDADAAHRPGIKYITHGIEGEAILRQEGFPEVICRFASHHTGAGLSAQDVINEDLPLPPGNYLADTDEELIIMYADKFHSKNLPPHFNSYETYMAYVTSYGAHKAARFETMAQKFGKPELKTLSEKYNHAIL